MQKPSHLAVYLFLLVSYICRLRVPNLPLKNILAFPIIPPETKTKRNRSTSFTLVSLFITLYIKANNCFPLN